MPSLGPSPSTDSRAGSTPGGGARSTSTTSRAPPPRRRVPGGRGRRAPRGLSRRGFLQILGASAALAGLEACQPPREKRRPVRAQPPGGDAVGAVRLRDRGRSRRLRDRRSSSTSWEGRPTKVEGNREHPASLGGSDALRQATILDLYDPARLAGFAAGPAATAPAAAARRARRARPRRTPRTAARGSASSSSPPPRRRSPTSAGRILARFPKARFDTWSAVADDARAPRAPRVAFGRPLEPRWHLADADVILSLDADFLVVEGEPLRQAARVRGAPRARAEMNRLYVAEAAYTVTGGMADHRFRMRGAEVLAFGRAVAAELAARHGLSQLAPLGAPVEGARAKAAAAVAKDLASRPRPVAGRRRAAAAAGGPRARRRAERRARERREDGDLPRRARCVDPDAGPDGLARARWRRSRRGRSTRSSSPPGTRSTRRPPTSTCAAPSARCRGSICPRAAAGRDGARRAAAPRRDPLPRGLGRPARPRRRRLGGPAAHRAALRERDARSSSSPPSSTTPTRGGWRIVRDGWRARAGLPPPPPLAVGTAGSTAPPDTNRTLRADPFDRRWDEWLAAGLVAGTAAAAETPRLDLARWPSSCARSPRPAPGSRPASPPTTRSGTAASPRTPGSPSCPNPVTKLTWDNAALLSPATAKRLGLSSGDVVGARASAGGASRRRCSSSRATPTTR